ncbi:MAG: GTP-binding protein [Candidatus Woesearchaeota archaeon]
MKTSREEENQAVKLRSSEKVDKQIKELEEEISSTKYNKKTQHHIGLAKAKLARLKEKKESRSSKGKKGSGFSVRKTGDGTVVLVGFPSVGKSTLLNAITNADSKIGSYAFTTLTCIPGLLEYKHAKIQILDVPGVVRGAAAGTGRGKEVLQVLRTADLCMLILDIFHPEHYKVLLKEIFDTDIRLMQKKPDVRITKTSRGGIRIGKTVKLNIKDETIKSILNEFKLSNADILIREKIDEDQLIDIIEGNKCYIPSIVIANKIDLANEDAIAKFKEKVKADLLISADQGTGIDELKELIFQRLNLIRIFLKENGKKADMEVPMIIFRDCTIRDVCEKLHRDFVEKFKFARIWGKSVKFDGMKIMKLDHQLKDEDILELHMS